MRDSNKSSKAPGDNNNRNDADATPATDTGFMASFGGGTPEKNPTPFSNQPSNNDMQDSSINNMLMKQATMVGNGLNENHKRATSPNRRLHAAPSFDINTTYDNPMTSSPAAASTSKKRYADGEEDPNKSHTEQQKRNAFGAAEGIH